MKSYTNFKFFIFLIISLAINPIILHAQTGQGQGRGTGAAPAIGVLQGSIVDKQTGEPLMFASIVLKREGDSTMVTGAITNEQGRFVMEQLPPGSFFITINYVGYPEQNFNSIRITFREPLYDMGVIEIEPAASLLGEVTVEAARQLMETGLDRRVINVDSELTSTGGSALELMRNIPSVSVDFDGNLSLRGSSNVNVLIDGRPSGLTGLSGSEALDQLPANMIERVEIITNPSVRFDPSGTSGIINVVLKKEKQPGYNGMASINVSTGNRYNGSLNMNYRVNKFNLFGNFSGRLSSNTGYGSDFRTSFLSETTYQDQLTNFESGMNSYNFQLGADYNLNSYNTITSSVSANQWNRFSDDFTEYDRLLSNMVSYDYFTRNSESNFDNNGLSYNLSYRRTYSQRFRELTADVNFSQRGISRGENMNQQSYLVDKSTNGDEILQKTIGGGDNWSFSAQMDYVHPLGDDRKLETGFRSTSRELDSDFNFFNFMLVNWQNDSRFSNQFIYDEQVHAVYGIFATMIGNYSLQTGLRAEQTFTRSLLKNTGEENDNQYLSFFPSLHLRRNLSNEQAVQVSYSRRINRPNNRNLNPFVQYNSPFDLSFGNPNLAPEFINSTELGYTKYWKNTTLNPSIFYRHTQGMVTRIRTMDEQGIAYTTFENLNTGLSFGAELIASQQVIKAWRVNGNFSYFRRVIKGIDIGGMEMRNDSYSWTARLNNSISLGKGFDLQVSGYYNSPVVLFQGEMDAMYSADIGLRKNVWNNQGTINLRVSDIFNTQKFSMFNYGDNFNASMERKRDSRLVYLGFTYRINDYDRRNQRNRQRGQEDSNGSMELDDFN